MEPREGVSDRPGQSRLGGVPDLPPSWTWPVSTRDEGKYLSFNKEVDKGGADDKIRKRIVEKLEQMGRDYIAGRWRPQQE